MPRKRRSFTPEFKSEAVRLCRVGDRTIAQVAHDLDLVEGSLREWIKRADGQATRSATLETNAPQPRTMADAEQEILRLRGQVKRLEMDRAILKKAAAFFAKENE